MGFNDYVLLSSVVVVIIGWFVNEYLQRKQVLDIRRVECRVELLRKFISFYIQAQKTKSLDGFNDIQVEFHIYGTHDEIHLIERVASIILTDSKDREWLVLLHRLNIKRRNDLRKKLGLPVLPNNIKSI